MKLAVAMILMPLFSLQAYGRVLPLDEFVELAKKNDPQFKRVMSEATKIDFLVDQGLPSRQFLISLQNEYGIASGSSRNTSTLSATLRKEIIESGTLVSVSQSNTKRPDREESVTQFRIEQPVYNNFFGRDVRLKKEALYAEEQVVRLEVLEAYETYLADLTKKYLDYSQAVLNAKLSEKVYEEALVLQKNVLRKKLNNIATQTDVDRARLQVLLKKEDLENKKVLLKSKLQEIRKVTGLEVENFSPETGLELEKKLLKDSLKNDFKPELIRSLRVLALKEDIANKNLLLKQRESDPSINLLAGYNIDQSRRFSLNVNRNEAVFGLKVEFPIWNTKGSAETSAAFLALTQSELEKRTREGELVKQYQDIKNQLIQGKEKLKISKEKVDLIERILKEEDRRYKFGKIELKKLLETKNQFAEFRFGYHSDLIAYNKIIIDWLNLNDLLLEKKEIKL